MAAAFTFCEAIYNVTRSITETVSLSIPKRNTSWQGEGGNKKTAAKVSNKGEKRDGECRGETVLRGEVPTFTAVLLLLPLIEVSPLHRCCC